MSSPSDDERLAAALRAVGLAGPQRPGPGAVFVAATWLPVAGDPSSDLGALLEVCSALDGCHDVLFIGPPEATRRAARLLHDAVNRGRPFREISLAAAGGTTPADWWTAPGSVYLQQVDALSPAAQGTLGDALDQVPAGGRSLVMATCAADASALLPALRERFVALEVPNVPSVAKPSDWAALIAEVIAGLPAETRARLLAVSPSLAAARAVDRASLPRMSSGPTRSRDPVGRDVFCTAWDRCGGLPELVAEELGLSLAVVHRLARRWASR